MLLTIWFYFVLVTTAIIASTMVIIVTSINPKSELPLRITHYWGTLLIRCLGIDFKVEGLENLDLSRPYVFAANHQSAFDIFALLAALPKVKFLAKKELFRIPLFGPALARAGSLPIDRSNRQASLKSLDRAAQVVREGSSIVIFPEGTRSETGELLPFKKGGFVLAIKSGQPIVPVSLSGTGAVLGRGIGRVHPNPIKAVFGRPIPTDTVKNVNKDQLMAQLREAILKNYDPYYGQERAKVAATPACPPTSASSV